MANPNTDKVIMAAIATIAPGYPVANTRLAQLGGPVVIQNLYQLATGKYPALFIEVGTQTHRILTTAGYDAQVQIFLTYYDRWDSQPNTIDTIRSQIDDDLQQIMQNLQANSSLIVNGVAYAMSIPTLTLSMFRGELEQMNSGLTLVKRDLNLVVNVPPYDVD